jgi:hypothetical protein
LPRSFETSRLKCLDELPLPKRQFPILRADFDPVTGFEFTRQQLRRERVEQVFLNRALERARAGNTSCDLIVSLSSCILGGAIYRKGGKIGKTPNVEHRTSNAQ